MSIAIRLRTLPCIVAILILAAGCLTAHQPHDPIVTVAVSPNYEQDHTVLAATDYLTAPMGVHALLRSTDGGVTWSVVPGVPNNSKITTVVFSPNYGTDQTIFAAGIGGIFRTSNQGASWNLLSRTSTPDLFLSPNFAVDNTVFVVTAKRTIYQSNNSGNTWTQIPTPAGLTSGLSEIVVSPNYDSDHTLWVGGNVDGILESTDGGGTWVCVTNGMPLPKITALVVSPNFTSDRTVLAATAGAGVLISTNGGSSWSAANAGITDLNVTSLSWAPGGVLWISTAGAGVFQSNNMAASWIQGAGVSRTLSPLTTTHYSQVVASNGGMIPTLYLAMYEGLWTSSDGAGSWQYIDTLPTRLVRHLKLSPNYAQDQTVFAATYGGGNLWSTTGGQSWIFQNAGMATSYTDAAGISPNFAIDGTAFSGMSQGLQATNDFGATWAQLPDLNAKTYPRGLEVSPDFAHDHTVLIGTANGDGYPLTATYEGVQVPNQGLFVSLDGGNDWIPTSLGGPPIASITISPGFASDRTAFAGSPTSGLFKSIDGGMTWFPILLPGGVEKIGKVVVSPAYQIDHTVVAGIIDGGIYKSVNGGFTWTLIPYSLTLRSLDIVFSPNWATDRTLFIGTAQAGLFKSTNGGASLQKMSSPDAFVTALAISPNFAQDATLFAACYKGLYKSTDAGATWAYTAEPSRVEESRNITSSNQQPPTIMFQGAWVVNHPTVNASSNAYMITREAGATGTFSFVGSGVRWLGRTGPQQGSASIQLDGVLQGIVSLNAPTDQYQQTLWEQHGIACGAHTLTLTAVLDPGQAITLDALDVWRDTCAFTVPGY